MSWKKRPGRQELTERNVCLEKNICKIWEKKLEKKFVFNLVDSVMVQKHSSYSLILKCPI